MNGYTNEAGEPIMSGEAWRFEQALDAREPECDPDRYLAGDDDLDEDDDDDGEHNDNDECSKYDSGYLVVVREDENDDGDREGDRRVESLEPGDHYRDPAFEAPGEWLVVADVARVDDDVHVDVEPADNRDETVSADGSPLPRGRCDTCGAPCDADTGECTAERNHPVALA